MLPSSVRWQRRTEPCRCTSRSLHHRRYVGPIRARASKPIDPSKRVILHCASGGRSALVAATLKGMGYERVAHLDGGFNAWKDAGKPTE